MAKKFLDLNGFKYFISKIIGKTSIAGIGDGTCTGAIYWLFHNMQKELEKPLYLHNPRITNWNDVDDMGWWSGSNAENSPENGWINAISIAANANTNYLSLIAICQSTGNLYVRTSYMQDDSFTWGNWTRIGSN